MRIEPFGVEQWMNEWENNCQHNLAETCVDSLTVAELLKLCGTDASSLEDLLDLRLGYGAIEGSDRLRSATAALYEKIEPDNVVVTHGAIGANALLYQTLVEPGDRVISVIPTYQQHYSIPESYGADVQLLHLRAENRFLPDLDELRELATANTSIIAINNPNNPTGALMDEALLKEIAEVAESVDAWLLSDEVYRGTDQRGDGTTVSVADLSTKGIGTGSMSKAFSLAGLRLGWIAAPTEVLEAVSVHRDYNTISVGMIDDHLAALALENADALLARSRRITRTNLAILDEWITSEPRMSYVKPQSGTTALLRYDLDMSSRDFCIELLNETGVMFTPGSALGIEGHVRVGFANATDVLGVGLGLLSAFLDRR